MAANEQETSQEIKVLSWNLLLDDLISNFIPRTMKDPPEELLKEVYKEDDTNQAKQKWRDLKAEMNEAYRPWHQMKDLIRDPNEVSQKLRALWSQPDLTALAAKGWHLGAQKEKVRDAVTLESHRTCLGVLQAKLGDKEGRQIYEAIAKENEHRTWDKRMPKILGRIRSESPDLVAFQEYDMHKLQAEKREFHQHMRDIGYEGVQLLCPGQERAGIGIFWKLKFSSPALRKQMGSGCLEAVQSETVLKGLKEQIIGNLDLQEKAEDGNPMKSMDRRSLGFVRLQIQERQTLLFCTTHLMTASRDLSGRVRTEELCTINNLMSDLVNPDEAVILCGDFNINSRGGAHDFIWTKKFPKGEKDVAKDRFVKVLEEFDSISRPPFKIRSKTIGEVQEIDTNGDALVKFESTGDDDKPARLEWVSQKDFKKMRSLDHTGYEKDREERRFVWERSDGRELKMRDAYNDIYGSNDASSTVTGMREETIDYIFFDEDLLGLKKKSALKCFGVMPNEQEPSDHIPLVVSFALPSAEVQLREGLRRLEHHLSTLLHEGTAGKKLAIDVLLPLMQESVEAALRQNLRKWLLTGEQRPEHDEEGEPSPRRAMLTRAQSLVGHQPRKPEKRGQVGITQPPNFTEGENFCVPEDFDWEKSTKENYVQDIVGQVSDLSYAEKYRSYRKLCDAEYHGLYSMDRQKWQDEQIDTLLKDKDKADAPWLLYTCGPMGVGKSFTLKWLQLRGYLNIQENMVKIDPDAIKEMMPEYKLYQRTNVGKHMAATHCHRESAYMMEIAQAAAMAKNLNVWVDGSLKDAEWYAKQFEGIRAKYRDYHIAIFYIGADEQTILKRVQQRADDPNGGRFVPDELVRSSMASMDKTLNVLTPFCDFVARIKNNGPSPVLQAIDSIDHSGIWEGLRARMDTTQSMRTSVDFPQSLRPLSLTSVSSESLELFKFDRANKLEVELAWPRSAGSSSARPRLRCSPRRPVALPAADTAKDAADDVPTRKALGIDLQAKECCWIYPMTMRFQQSSPAEFVHLKQEGNPLACVLENGGFCYLNEEEKIVALTAIVPVGRAKMQFQRRESSSKDANGKAIDPPTFEPEDISYWHDVTLEFLKKRGADQFAYLAPGEESAKGNKVQVGGKYGSFAYKFRQGEKQEVVVFDFIGAGTL